MMMKKVLSYGAVGLVTAALLGGTAAILLSPADAQAQRQTAGGSGQTRESSEIWPRGERTGNGSSAYGQGQGSGRGNAGGGGSSLNQGGYGLNQDADLSAEEGGTLGHSGAGNASGRSASERAGELVSVEWETVSGTVTLIDHEVTIQTAEGEVLVGMGQAAFEDFALSVGDSISVTGFYEDGEFKAGTVENLTNGETITLRDEGGRPMWSGRGRLKNQ